jgi:hypothetical protein
MSRAFFLRVVRKSGCSGFSAKAVRTACAGHRRLAQGMICEGFRKQFMPTQNSVQQHSGDWTMTGKVPVARGLKA